jgi:hypothetical protein
MNQATPPAGIHVQVHPACSYSCTSANRRQFFMFKCKPPAVIHVQVQAACIYSCAAANRLQLFMCSCKPSEVFAHAGADDWHQ